MLLIDRFEEVAAQTPDAVFVHYVGETVGQDVLLSYGEAERRACDFARTLLDLGVRKGHTLALLLPNSVEWLVYYFGCQKIGAISTGLNCALPVADLKTSIELVEAKIVVTDQAHLGLAEELAACCPLIATILCDGAVPGCRASMSHDEAGRAPLPFDPGLNDNDYLSIVFTSGTTGAAPKAALQRNGSVTHGIEGYRKRLRLRADDRLMVVTPLFHGSALNWGVTMVVLSGATLVLTGRFRASLFWEQAERARTTVLWTMAAVVLILLERPVSAAETRALRMLRTIYGAAIGARYAAVRARWPVEVFDGFGMTETPGTLTDGDCHGLDVPFACVGRPVDGIDLKIVDPTTGSDLPRGATGEIVVRYGQGFAGYYNNPVAFDEVVRNGWFHTGDLAFQDEQDRVFFVDRLKSIIRRGGENISSIEVEQALVLHPAVLDAIALPKPHPILGDTVLAVLVLRDGMEAPSLAALHELCRTRLADFKWPEEIRVVDADIVPRTETGRVKRPLLRQRLGL